MRRDFRLCAWLYGFAPGLLLALLFLFPQAAMQGVKDGLLLWTQAVLPALLPFFVVTSLLQSSGALDLLSPLAAPRKVGYYLTHANKAKQDLSAARWKIGFLKRLAPLPLPYDRLYAKMKK